jgi:hypothetical protein
MKQPRLGIQSTTKRPVTPVPPQITPVPVITHDVQPIPAVRPPILPLFQAPPAYPGPACGAMQGNHPPRLGPNVIDNDETESIANVFCFGAFADKRDGVVYNDLTGSFPFMLLDGSVCFLSCIITKQTQYWRPLLRAWMIQEFSRHTKCNSITSPQRGNKPKINIMDNQATKHIKAFLTEQQCQLQLVKPHIID